MKRAWITGLLVICFGMSGAVAQDTEAKEDQDSVDRDAKDSLTKALRKSSDYGGMKVEGAVAPVTSDDEEEGGRPRRGGFGRGFGGRGGGSFEGMFTALINSKGDAKITVETENSKSEIYKIGDAIASVTYGRGTNARPLGNFPSEVAKVLDFAGLVKQLGDATAISSGRNERVGDAACMTFNCTIKPEEPELDEDEDEELDFRSLMRGGSRMIREIRTKVWIDEDTGVIRKISVEMERGLSDAMMERLRERMGGRGGRRGGDDPRGRRRRGGDDPDDDDQERPRGRRRRGGDDPDDDDQERPRRGRGGRRGGFGGMRSSATAYEIEILEYLDDVKIEVPEELEEYLED